MLPVYGLNHFFLLLTFIFIFQNSTLTPSEEHHIEPAPSPINLEIKNETPTPPILNENLPSKMYDEIIPPNLDKETYELANRCEKDRLSKLDQVKIRPL